MEVAPLSSTVLIGGPSGAGKEVLARAIHANSVRSARPFVAINCAAIPDTLLETELFGYQRGAFTGATHTKIGLLESARGGTVLLDEIAEVDPSIQAKLLHFLQSRSFCPVGSVRYRQAEVRIIAATNVPLQAAVEGGSFREDLYYRLCVFPLQIPALTERRDDIVPLAIRFLERLEGQVGKAVPGLSHEAARFLSERPWRGNVRELQNAVERAVIVSRGNLLTSADFRVLEGELKGEAASPGGLWRLPEDGLDLEGLVRSLTLQAVERSSYNVSRAARLLGVTRATLRYRLKKYGLGESGI
jgi:two-component system response regulator PilR (NtrC family)